MQLCLNKGQSSSLHITLTMPLPPEGTTSPLAVDSRPIERAVPLGLTVRRLSTKPPRLRRLSMSCPRVGVRGPLPALMRRVLAGGDPVSMSPAQLYVS